MRTSGENEARTLLICMIGDVLSEIKLKMILVHKQKHDQFVLCDLQIGKTSTYITDTS